MVFPSCLSILVVKSHANITTLLYLLFCNKSLTFTHSAIGSSFQIPDITNRPLQDPADELHYRFFFLVNSALVFINPVLSVPDTPESTVFAAAIPGFVKLVPDPPDLT